MRHTAVIGAGLAVFLAAAPALAQEAQPSPGPSQGPYAAIPQQPNGAPYNGPYGGPYGGEQYAPPPSNLYDGFMWYRIEPLNSTPSMARYLANECIIAGVGAMAVTAILASPVAPAVAAALGAGPGMTMLEIGAIGCGGGVAAGVASASVVWAWEEEGTIRDAAQTQIAGLIDGYTKTAAAIGEGMAKAWNEPVATVQTAVAAVAEGTASLLGQSGHAAGSAVQMAAATVSGWWYGQPHGVDDFVTYETASLAGVRDGEIVIH